MIAFMVPIHYLLERQNKIQFYLFKKLLDTQQQLTTVLSVALRSNLLGKISHQKINFERNTRIIFNKTRKEARRYCG